MRPPDRFILQTNAVYENITKVRTGSCYQISPFLQSAMKKYYGHSLHTSVKVSNLYPLVTINSVFQLTQIVLPNRFIGKFATFTKGREG